MLEKLYWVWLTTRLGFSAVSVNKVLYKFTPELAFKATKEELVCAGLEESTAQKLSDKNLERAEDIIDKCIKKDINIIHAGMPEYPRSLERLNDKPCVLYVRGDINCLKGKKTVAFIGTRSMTERGKEYAEDIANSLIDEGKLLVSGIADGIDSVAAKVSLKRGVPTVAVLGVDIDKYYPKINERLIDSVAQSGAVISEYPPNTNARYFASRNRIIVGLSDSVNVIEASCESGAMIGGKKALKMKIPTFALALDGSNFDGCRELITLGAKPLQGSDSLPSSSHKTIPKPVKKEKKHTEAEIPDSISPTARHIWQRLLQGECHDSDFIDDKHKISDVLVSLTELEIEGYIVALPGSKYRLK